MMGVMEDREVWRLNLGLLLQQPYPKSEERREKKKIKYRLKSILNFLPTIGPLYFKNLAIVSKTERKSP